MAILFYESPNTSVAVLSRVAKGCSGQLCRDFDYGADNPIYKGDVRNSSWIDVSPALRKQCGVVCSAAFASSLVMGDSTNFGVITYFRPKRLAMETDLHVLDATYAFLENSGEPGDFFCCM